MHKTDCIQKRPMTAITAIGRKMLGTEGNSALAELGRATSSLQAVLREFLSCFPLISGLFWLSASQLSGVRTIKNGLFSFSDRLMKRTIY